MKHSFLPQTSKGKLSVGLFGAFIALANVGGQISSRFIFDYCKTLL